MLDITDYTIMFIYLRYLATLRSSNPISVRIVSYNKYLERWILGNFLEYMSYAYHEICGGEGEGKQPISPIPSSLLLINTNKLEI